MGSVLISGGSRGIGRELCRIYASAGYDIATCAKKSGEELEEIGREVQSHSVGFYGTLCDVSVHDEVKNFCRGVKERFGCPDILINNAGISDFGMLQNLDVARWKEIIDCNLGSAFYFCKEILPDMLTLKKGRIINISSVWGEAGASCEVAYSASKAGLNGFTRALAKEVAPSGISVNAVEPGFINTDMNSIFDKEEIDEIIKEIPASRAGSAAEISKFIFDMANMDSYFTGQIVRFDGGWK